uniref:Uncharacterized protein n=1 Tax=Opuntia streptacantha TaxID=393608 RepID=A0A7C8YPW7_OPUST
MSNKIKNIHIIIIKKSNLATKKSDLYIQNYDIICKSDASTKKPMTLDGGVMESIVINTVPFRPVQTEMYRFGSKPVQLMSRNCTAEISAHSGIMCLPVLFIFKPIREPSLLKT